MDAARHRKTIVSVHVVVSGGRELHDRLSKTAFLPHPTLEKYELHKMKISILLGIKDLLMECF